MQTKRNQLKKIQTTTQKEIEKQVCNWLLSKSKNDEELNGTLQDLASGGCASAIVSQLICRSQTHAFFDEHYEEIMDIRDVYKQNFNQEPNFGSDVKNDLAWFAFEWSAYKIAKQLRMPYVD